ncbi:hypothetical protein Q0M94_17940 (plasmid) [Deinococcus radiomollis]|uniref:hypothetical protein n=1 Tax=Deinococcus radiomollis TaxID=468916 RepID=UPI00389172CD
MTDANTNPKKTTQISITTLSMELISIPPTEQCYIHENYENALRRRIFRALKDESATYKARYYNSAGELVEEDRPEEHVETSDAWKAWLEEQRAASKLQIIKVRRDYRITADQISKNPTDFEVLAKLRQADLEREARAAQAKKEAPAAPVKQTPTAQSAKRASGRRVKPTPPTPDPETEPDTHSELLDLEPLAAASAN